MLTDKKSPAYSNPKIWGGIECTINRVEDTYYDQLTYSGYYSRNNNIEALAGLGISKLRFPILWEFHEREKGMDIDWSWSEDQLSKIHEIGIDPIVTLLHHGSGPNFTNLLDESFPELLAEYAKKVALKFPEIKYYTPVNEPLTTARFSGLYGFWYPHKKNDVSFIKMLLNQVKGVILSMRAIRSVNPEAKLIQTEDLGKTYSKPSLEYQAVFENHRRWLTYDLLTGNFLPDHPMWAYCARLGIDEADLKFFHDNPCTPDIMGMNYYVTSERYLDDEIRKYEKHTHGSNDLQTYADIEAVRVPHAEPLGLKGLLREAWERYQIPIAITEAHINCHREEQMRWIKDIWEDCCALCNEGVPIRGVTAWSLFGAHGWNKLLITKDKDYESGVFDIRSGTVRKTALATMLSALSDNGNYSHPVVEVPGWWKRNLRFLKSFKVPDQTIEEIGLTKLPAPLLIIGKTGTLGKAFERACLVRKIHHVLVGREEVDITNDTQIKQIIARYKPWGIINTAGYVRVDDAESDKENCINANATGVKLLAENCNASSIQFMTFSSDLVFGGDQSCPYIEIDKPNPLNVYGESKHLAERAVMSVNPSSLIIRTSTFFSPHDPYNFVYNIINDLSNSIVYNAPDDIFFSPTYVPDLVDISLDLLIDNEKGIWHLSSGEKWSWYSIATKIASVTGLDDSFIHVCNADEMNYRALRPKYSVLGTTRGILLPSFEEGLRRYLHDVKYRNRNERKFK